jgi:hypothetical protein
LIKLSVTWGVTTLPTLKKSYPEITIGEEAQETIKNLMIDVNQGVHLVGSEWYATLLKKVKQGFEITRKGFWPTILEKQ